MPPGSRHKSIGLFSIFCPLPPSFLSPQGVEEALREINLVDLCSGIFALSRDIIFKDCAVKWKLYGGVMGGDGFFIDKKDRLD